jgi:Fe-S oxidoreductase
MAGSFGYEKEHYDISMQMVKTYFVSKAIQTQLAIAAAGMSCRHQIYDGTETAQHPVSI